MGDRSEAQLAEAVREACLRAAIEAWEGARMAGLCAEGAWEAAVGAIRSVELPVASAEGSAGAGSGGR